MASEDSRSRLEIDWLKTLAGALAAVSSAVLLSTLGAAGTVIGAALGSVVVTVGSALYSQGLHSSRQRLTQAQVAAARVRSRNGRPDDSRPDSGPDSRPDSSWPEGSRRGDSGYDERTVPDEAAAGETDGWRQRLALLPWKHLALLAAALFVATIVAITAFELVAGRSVASFTGGGGSGGTTLTHLGGGGSRQAPDRHPTPTPTTTTGGSTPGEPTTGATSSEGATSGASPSEGTSPGATAFGTTAPSSPTSSAPVTSPSASATPPAAPGVTP